MEAERHYYYHPGPNRFTFFAGVILPTISITVEATTHICAGVFFDPIPTIWHLMLVIFVPLAQLQVSAGIFKGSHPACCLGPVMRLRLKLRLRTTCAPP